MIITLLILLTISAVVFGVVFIKDYRTAKKKGKLETNGNAAVIALIGFFVCFFDALGLGGFAPLMVLFKQFKLVKDQIIPGTLNTAMCIPVIMEAFIFIKEVSVDITTLISMVIAAVLGAVVGAGIVAKMDEKKVQLGISMALSAVLFFMLAGKLGYLPSGGGAIGLTGIKLGMAIAGNFLLGALMTLGIGLYAPCMALVYALGLSPIAAFPIMMGSCAFLMPAASIKFIKEGAYNRRCTMLIAIAGIIGVIMAAYLVKSLPLNLLTYLIMGVIGYTAIKLFVSSRKGSSPSSGKSG
jgi:uncharacterized membrane protein YfcA